MLQRIRSGLVRRFRWLRWRLAGDRPTPAEEAFAWLFGPATVDFVPAEMGGRQGCPSTTRAAIPVAMDYGMTDRARRWQQWLRSQGEPAAQLDVLPALAHDETAAEAGRAVASFQAGQKADGDRRMRELANGRLRSGLATICYLKAALLQVEAAFAGPADDLPDTIDPADGRVQAVLRWAGSLAANATLADVGCGKGRFLRHLAATFPGLSLVGIDPSPTMLARLPPGVEARRGSLLTIPAADSQFDAAMAVESLEHALVPVRAIEELCRVVRPGGSVLVIDKHRAAQALSEHQPWERWFWPEELAGWLGRFCDEIRVERVSHLEGRPGNRLFLAASGRRRDGS